MINWSDTLLCHIFVDHVLHHLATTWWGKWSTATILLLLWWSLTASPMLLVAGWDGLLSLLLILTAYSKLVCVLRRLLLRAEKQGWLLKLVLLIIWLHRLIRSLSYFRLEGRGALWLLPIGEGLRLRRLLLLESVVTICGYSKRWLLQIGVSMILLVVKVHLASFFLLITKS